MGQRAGRGRTEGHCAGGDGQRRRGSSTGEGTSSGGARHRAGQHLDTVAQDIVYYRGSRSATRRRDSRGGGSHESGTSRTVLYSCTCMGASARSPSRDSPISFRARPVLKLSVKTVSIPAIQSTSHTMGHTPIHPIHHTSAIQSTSYIRLHPPSIPMSTPDTFAMLATLSGSTAPSRADRSAQPQSRPQTAHRGGR